jgi:hypothetical protein
MALITLWKTDHTCCVLQLSRSPQIWDKVLVLTRDGIEIRRRGVCDHDVQPVSDRWHAEMINAEHLPPETAWKQYLHAVSGMLGFAHRPV